MKLLTSMLLVSMVLFGCAGDTDMDKTKSGLASGQATTLSPVIISSDDDIMVLDPKGNIWTDNPVSILGIEEGLFCIFVCTENPGERTTVGIRIDGSETVHTILEQGTYSAGYQSLPYTFNIHRIETIITGNNQ